MNTFRRTIHTAGVAVVLLTAVVLTGCGRLFGVPDAPQACTLIGCTDFLAVSLSEPVPDDFTIELTPESGETLFVRCSGGQRVETDSSPGAECFADGAHFPVTPEHAHIEISWTTGFFETDVTPAYSVSQPNGPGCEPICRQGTVILDLP